MHQGPGLHLSRAPADGPVQEALAQQPGGDWHANGVAGSRPMLYLQYRQAPRNSATLCTPTGQCAFKTICCKIQSIFSCKELLLAEEKGKRTCKAASRASWSAVSPAHSFSWLPAELVACMSPRQPMTLCFAGVSSSRSLRLPESTKATCLHTHLNK